MCNVKGIVKEIEEVKTTTSGFRTQRIAVLEDGQYGTIIPIEFLGDKVDLSSALKVDQAVNVSINMKGTIYNEKRYVSLTGWKIE